MTTQQRYDARKLRAIETITGGPIACQLCGFVNPHALQFDHITQLRRGPCVVSASGRPYYHTSGGNLIRSILNGSTPKEDIQVLCANCHAIKTTEDKRK